MKIRFHIILLILSSILLFSCSKWVKSINGDGLYLPYEAGNQGDTIYVDTLKYLHFGYSIYETESQIQISPVNNFETLLFDSQCHEYSYIQIPEVSLTYFAQVPIDKFQLNSPYYCKIRYLTESYFISTHEWSDWSRVGYFTLTLSKVDN